MLGHVIRIALPSLLTVLCLGACETDKRLEAARESAAEGPASRDGACDATCGELNYDCCRQRTDDCQPLIGAHVEKDMACVMPNAFAGCQTKETACEPEITHAVSPDGKCWKLMSSCLPSKEWRTITGDEKADCEESLSTVSPC